MSSRVLLVDDEATMCETLAKGLARRGFRVEWRTRADEAFALLAREEFHVVVTDLRLRGMSGVELCDRIVANRPDVPVIAMTAFGSLEAAIETIRAGVFDFLPKPFEVNDLVLALERAISQRALRDEVKRLREKLAAESPFEELIGKSAAMRDACDLVARVAGSDVSVLVTGESGTGKELVARALHRRSARHAGPFVTLNCAAMPEALLESELFGHARGAFTDARSSRQGLFLEAHGGTLFLDEIGEMSLVTQAKVLRALEERTVRAVGTNEERPFDARIVAATNRDLESAVEAKLFREDLFYRINVMRIELPPLRSRGGDVLLLAQHFLMRNAQQAGKALTGMSSAVAERLLAYSWPGNVRELRNCIERAVALARFEQIAVEDLPDKIKDYKGSSLVVAGEDPAELSSLEEMERRYIMHVMRVVAGNKSSAARILGLDRKTLYRKLQQYGALE